MKSIFDPHGRETLITRVGSLNEVSTAQWGTMNVHQMLQHCILCEEMYMGMKKVKRSFIGRIFGKAALKNMLKDDRPLKKNSPTNPVFLAVSTQGDIDAEKQQWISLLEQYAEHPATSFEHWFFGKMTKDQVGKFVYKHADHHLRQFNC